jgi:PAS domain S-box-containing protein
MSQYRWFGNIIRGIFVGKRHSKEILTIFVIVVSLIIGYQTFCAISQDKELTVQSERENGLVVVRLLEEHANQQLSSAAARLNDVAEAIKSTPKITPKDEQLIHGVIEEIFTNEGSSNSLLYVNPEAERWTSPKYFPYFVYATESRPYIEALIKQPQRDKILVGHVMRRFVDNDLVLPIARNLHSSDGVYLGLISIDISLGYFNSVYATVASKEGTSVTLLSNTGQVIVNSDLLTKGNEFQPKKFNFPRDLDTYIPEGHFEFLDFANSGSKTLYTYKKLKSFPHTVLYGRNPDVMMREWYERSKDRIIFSAVFILLHLALTWYLLRHMLMVEQSEVRLRKSEELFTALFQHSPVPLAMLNLKTDQLVEVNKAFEVLSELSRAELLHRKRKDTNFWVSGEARSKYLAQLLEHGHVNEYEAEFSSATGKIRLCKISAKLINPDDEQLVVFSTIDVTAIRESEKYILRLNAELELRVLERTSKLQDALASVTSLQSRLSRTEKLMALGSLVTGMAHELSTPIGNSVTISSALEAFTNELINELSNERPRRSIMVDTSRKIVEGVQIISKNINRAVDLISTFKQVSVEHAMHKKSSFDLKELIENKVLSIENLRCSDIELVLDLQPNISLSTYADAIIHVFDQLIENSQRHAFDDCESKKIVVSTRELNSDEVEITYADNGIGVHESQINRVFEPFYTTKFYDGSSGLGMHIVYNLVTGSLNGNISLSNRIDGGLLVEIVIPKNSI